MLSWKLDWIRRLLIRWGILSTPPPIGAAAAMAELRARRQAPADVDDWEALVRRFNTQVFSDEDRRRVWRRYRRKYKGELCEWGEILRPTAEDQACLKQILDDLAR